MRVGIYVRVSTQEQAKEGYSVGEQQKRLEKYCEAKGWDVYDVYIDGGYSGADTDRPALQRMLRDIADGRIEGVLVYKLDRLSRSQRDTMTLIEEVFLPAGVDFVSMTENLDTSTPVGMAMVGLLAVFAQLERAQIAERMAVGIEARARDGYYHGNKFSPVGYDYRDGLLHVIPYEAMMVKEAFEEVAQRKSVHSVCRNFEQRGYRHRYGPFLARSVGKMLRNPLYAGYIENDGELYEGKHDAIVTRELFNRVQKVLADRDLSNPNRKASFKANSALAGLLRCKHCGARYCRVLGHKKQDGTKSAFYVCYSRNKKVRERIKDPNCKNKIWRMEELDNVVYEAITRLSLDPAFIEDIRSASRDEDQRARRLELVTGRIGELSEQISNTTKLFSVSGLDIEEVRAQLDPLTTERQQLRAELAALQQEASVTVEETYELARSFGDVLERGDVDETRLAVEELIDEIVLDGDKMTIRWSFV